MSTLYSKRHYEHLADWLNTAAIATLDDMAANLFTHSLADRLERDNPRFDRARFLKAAGCDRRQKAYGEMSSRTGRAA